jgi:hypothetical protein
MPYAIHAICLPPCVLSLRLVLRVCDVCANSSPSIYLSPILRNTAVAESVRVESTLYGQACPANLTIEVGFCASGGEEEEDSKAPTHGAMGALLHVDAPRRELFRQYR